ncbi:Mce family protein [Gordonia effusa NBRC 100432]|uniref:Mce family protein n=1 Tax=Gordonia effusa NBRC 100432 TaxID=1077974 RepID=H0R4X5_9ACTN|nr:MlaD family protein [Gordonia effusa]GAB20126.1 Mce family protein [Gordonia effusa NBRC 100432]
MKSRAAQAQNRFELRVGIVALLVTIVALLVAAGTAVIPFGEKVYRAEFNSSGDARVGDEVRIAGIPVGSVRGIKLVRDHVEIEFSVDGKVRLGEETHVVIKLLTPIGGRYFDVKPAGKGTADGKLIPREYTSTPYDLSSALEVATPALMKLDASKLRKSISKLAGAFENRPNDFNILLGQVNKLSAIVYQRKQQLARALRVSTTYLDVVMGKMERIRAAGDQILEVYREVAQRREGIVVVVSQVRRLFDAITVPIHLYDQLIEEPLFQGFDMIDKSVVELLKHKKELDFVSKELEPLLRWFAGNSENPYFTVDDSNTTITGTPLCPTGRPGC